MVSTEKLKYGSYYHIYNKGVNDRSIFKEKRNYYHFLEKYAYFCFPVIETFSYCLMKNHFHFFIKVRTKPEQIDLIKEIKSNYQESPFRLSSSKDFLNPSRVLSHIFNSYTQAFNKAYNRNGGLFLRPFRRNEINSDDYFCRLIYYIHQNPKHHRIVKDFRNYPYSSYQAFISEKSTLINELEAFNMFGGKNNFIQSHNKMEERLNLELQFEDF